MPKIQNLDSAIDSLGIPMCPLWPSMVIYACLKGFIKSNKHETKIYGETREPGEKPRCF